jgi:O-acetylhomoserine/O-acetylserine sulfhydrylase
VYLKKFSIGVKFISTNKPEDYAAAIDDQTKAIFVESIGNPGYIVPDLRALAKVRLPLAASRDDSG